MTVEINTEGKPSAPFLPPTSASTPVPSPKTTLTPQPARTATPAAVSVPITRSPSASLTNVTNANTRKISVDTNMEGMSSSFSVSCHPFLPSPSSLPSLRVLMRYWGTVHTIHARANSTTGTRSPSAKATRRRKIRMGSIATRMSTMTRSMSRGSEWVAEAVFRKCGWVAMRIDILLKERTCMARYRKIAGHDLCLSVWKSPCDLNLPF